MSCWRTADFRDDNALWRDGIGLWWFLGFASWTIYGRGCRHANGQTCFRVTTLSKKYHGMVAVMASGDKIVGDGTRSSLGADAMVTVKERNLHWRYWHQFVPNRDMKTFPAFGRNWKGIGKLYTVEAKMDKLKKDWFANAIARNRSGSAGAGRCCQSAGTLEHNRVSCILLQEFCF